MLESTALVDDLDCQPIVRDRGAENDPPISAEHGVCDELAHKQLRALGVRLLKRSWNPIGQAVAG
jgi:hypothetical protein